MMNCFQGASEKLRLITIQNCKNEVFEPTPGIKQIFFHNSFYATGENLLHGYSCVSSRIWTSQARMPASENETQCYANTILWIETVGIHSMLCSLLLIKLSKNHLTKMSCEVII